MSEEIFDVVIGGEPKKVKIVGPSPRVEAEANMYASKVFSKLAREHSESNSSLLLRDQLDKFLRDAQIYTAQDFEKIAELQKELEDGQKALAAGGKKSEGRAIALKMRKARYTLLLMLAKRFEYDKNTIEYHSENARLNYIISKCLRFEDGSQIFGGPDDYEFDESGLKNCLAPAIRRIGALCGSYDENYEAKLPENKFLVKYQMCNDKFDLVDSEGHLVNEDGQRIDKDGNLLESNEPKFEVGEFSDD